MKAVVFYGVGDIRITDAPDPKILQRNDAIVRLTASAICGTTCIWCAELCRAWSLGRFSDTKAWASSKNWGRMSEI